MARADAAQAMWRRLEPIHAVTYFSPEAREEFAAAGLRGFWRGYFAGRLAPLGAVGPDIATPLLYVFAPAMVTRALPDVWTHCSPSEALSARLRGVARTLAPLVGDEREAAALARVAADACNHADRPLAAANHALPWPGDDALALWQAATVLREDRGDGHVAVLRDEGIDPCMALVLHAATGIPEPVHLQANRGWTDDEWRSATERLTARGYLDSFGVLTAAGAEARQRIEARTDERAAEPYERLGAARVERLAELLDPLVARIADLGVVPYPNPMGVPRP